MNRQEFVAYAQEKYHAFDSLSKLELAALAEQWSIETMLHADGKVTGGKDELSASAVMTRVGRQLQELVRSVSHMIV